MLIPLLTHYLKVLHHKCLVFYYGRRLNVSYWKLLIHDVSKFHPSEAYPYALNFFGPPSIPKDYEGFKAAFALHCKRNPHHYQHWGKRPMPQAYAFEMLADHLAASRTYEGKEVKNLHEWAWLIKNYHTISNQVHPVTMIHYNIALYMYFGAENMKLFQELDVYA